MTDFVETRHTSDGTMAEIVDDAYYQPDTVIPRPIDRIELKLWRVYYNCREHFPHLVAVDNGSIESQIRVQKVAFYRCGQMYGMSDMGVPHNATPQIAARKGKPDEPTWWLELEAIAVFDKGGVAFYGVREL